MIFIIDKRKMVEIYNPDETDLTVTIVKSIFTERFIRTLTTRIY